MSDFKTDLVSSPVLIEYVTILDTRAFVLEDIN